MNQTTRHVVQKENVMRIRPIPLLCTAAVLAVSTLSSISHASGLNVNVDVGIPVGAPPPPPPAYAPPPPVQVVLPATPPQFVFVPELGYYVAVGTPYDIAYI